VTLPGNVQYAWPHPSRHYFYVAWSTGGPPTAGVSSSGGRHGVSAFTIDPVSGALHSHGPPGELLSRPIHVSTDIPGTHLLVAYNDPSGVTVHRINPDGTIGSAMELWSCLRDWMLESTHIKFAWIPQIRWRFS
jgi:6-phosphogluconolactonase (cycloisomerase 2 family)